MPSRQRTPLAATPQGQGSAAPGSQVAEPTHGNAAQAEALGGLDGSIAEHIPDPLALEGLGVSFRMPGNTLLTKDWNHLTTTGPTTVWIDMTSEELSVRFWPALLVDVQWPLSNVEWSGVTWDMKQGGIKGVDVKNSQWLAFGAEGQVESAVSAFITGLMKGTPLAAGNYDPMQDPNPDKTLGMLRDNATSNAGDGNGSDVGADDITHVMPNASIKTTTEIREGTGEGGVHIPAGTAMRISVLLQGNAEELAEGGVPLLDAVHLTTDGVVLESDGEPIAKLQQVSILRGGGVTVDRYEPLGKLKEAGDVESGLKGLLLLFQVAAMRENVNPGRLITNLDPNVIDGVATGRMEDALNDALHGLLDAHHDVVPGVDLRTVLGIPSLEAPNNN